MAMKRKVKEKAVVLAMSFVLFMGGVFALSMDRGNGRTIVLVFVVLALLAIAARVPSPLPWPMCNTFAATIAMTAIRAASVPTAGRSLRWRTPICTWFSRSTSRGRNPAR